MAGRMWSPVKGFVYKHFENEDISKKKTINIQCMSVTSVVNMQAPAMWLLSANPECEEELSSLMFHVARRN